MFACLQPALRGLVIRHQTTFRIVSKSPNIKSGNLEQVSLYRDFLGQNRTKLARLEAAKESIEGQKTNGPRETHAALDALSRIGGGSFGGDYAREQLTVQKEMAASLKAIENKGTQKSGDWQ